MKIKFYVQILVLSLVNHGAHAINFSANQIHELDEILTAASQEATSFDRSVHIAGREVLSSGHPIGFPYDHPDRNGKKGMVYTCNYRVTVNRSARRDSTTNLDCVEVKDRALDRAVARRQVLFANLEQCRRSCSQLMVVDFEEAQRDLQESLHRGESIASMRNPIIDGFKNLVKQSENFTRFIRKNSRYDGIDAITRPWVKDFNISLQTPFGWVSHSFRERFQNDNYMFQYISVSDSNSFLYESEHRTRVTINVKDLILWGARNGIVVRHPFISDLEVSLSKQGYLRIFVRQDLDSIIVLPLYRTEWTNFFLRDFNAYKKPITGKDHNRKLSAYKAALQSMAKSQQQRESNPKPGVFGGMQTNITIPVPKQSYRRHKTEVDARRIVQAYHEILLITDYLPIDELSGEDVGLSMDDTSSTTIERKAPFEQISREQGDDDDTIIPASLLTPPHRCSVDGNILKHDDFGRPYY